MKFCLIWREIGKATVLAAESNGKLHNHNAQRPAVLNVGGGGGKQRHRLLRVAVMVSAFLLLNVLVTIETLTKLEEWSSIGTYFPVVGRGDRWDGPWFSVRNFAKYLCVK